MCWQTRVRGERVARIIPLMPEGVITAEDIADELGVSLRTVYRYMAELKASMPIRSQAGMGYMLRPGLGRSQSWAK